MNNNKLINIAKDVVATEIVSLKKLNKTFNKSFLQAVELINKCSGKVILAGIGKSGLISRKISATLSSVGIPSFYLHPSEAAHGDLGQITRDDVLLILSYSGETEELKSIIQFTSRFGINIIGIASRKDSLLIKASNVKIVLPNVKEAGIGGLAPTSSTTLMLAFGDALAVALQHKRKFNVKIFKHFHPAGQLGKTLLMAKDLMFEGNKIPLINENKNISKAIKIMNKKKLGCVVTVNTKKLVTGFLSDGDLRRKGQKLIYNKPVKLITSKNPFFVNESTLAVKAIEIMNKKKITTLLITSDKENIKKNKKLRLKGILHIHSLLKRGIN